MMTNLDSILKKYEEELDRYFVSHFKSINVDDKTIEDFKKMDYKEKTKVIENLIGNLDN